MRLLLFVAAMVALGLTGWNFNAVLEELRRSLPPQCGKLDLRTIWTPAASDTVRWRYFWSHLWGSLYALLMGILLWLSDNLIGAALCGGLSVLTYAYIAWKYYGYKPPRPES